MHNQIQNHIHGGEQYSWKLECDSCLNVIIFYLKEYKYINGEEEIITKKGGHSQKGKQ